MPGSEKGIKTLIKKGSPSAYGLPATRLADYATGFFLVRGPFTGSFSL